MRQYAYTIERFQADLEAKFAWPGGYPLYFICSDGEALCHSCAEREQTRIIEAIRDNDSTGWRVIACDINYESELWCDHCGFPIQSAYGLPGKDSNEA